MCDKIFKVIKFFFAAFMLFWLFWFIPLVSLFDAKDCASYKKELKRTWTMVKDDLLGDLLNARN